MPQTLAKTAGVKEKFESFALKKRSRSDQNFPSEGKGKKKTKGKRRAVRIGLSKVT